MSYQGTSVHVLITTLVCSLFGNSDGHGQLFEPPSRQSAFRFGYSTPTNYNYDMQLNCGGFSNQWVTNGGKCGICGDPYQGPREYEAGGKFASSLMTLRNYTEGQLVDVHINLRVGHGGWSEFRICPNNDPHTPATQQCLDKYLLATAEGVTRIEHLHRVTGVFKYKLRLPRGLTCSQCVMQWKWNTGSNNNCVSGTNCCNGCGPQEQFYGCADVAILPSSTSNVFVTSSPTRSQVKVTSSQSPIPVRQQATTSGLNFIGGFIPIDLRAAKVDPCVATILGRSVYGFNAANSQCRRQCAQAITCPVLLCAESCFAK